MPASVKLRHLSTAISFLARYLEDMEPDETPTKKALHLWIANQCDICGSQKEDLRLWAADHDEFPDEEPLRLWTANRKGTAELASPQATDTTMTPSRPAAYQNGGHGAMSGYSAVDLAKPF